MSYAASSGGGAGRPASRSQSPPPVSSSASLFSVSGATGPLADGINGLYDCTREMSGGYPVYVKRGGEICIEHVSFGGNREWQVKTVSAKGQSKCFAAVSGGCALDDCIGREWEVGDGEGKNVFLKQRSVTLATEVEGFRLSGATGVLACLNGIWEPTAAHGVTTKYCLRGNPALTFKQLSTALDWSFWVSGEYCGQFQNFKDNSIQDCAELSLTSHNCLRFAGSQVQTCSIKVLLLSDPRAQSSCSDALSIKGDEFYCTILRRSEDVEKTSKCVEGPWDPATVPNFHSKKAELEAHIDSFIPLLDTSRQIRSIHCITTERHERAREIAREQQSAAEVLSLRKAPEHISAEKQRDSTARQAEETRGNIEILRRQLQKEEANLSSVETLLVAQCGIVAQHERTVAEVLERRLTEIFHDRDTAIAAADEVSQACVAELDVMARSAAASQILLEARISEIETEKQRWKNSVCMKSAAEITQLDVQRLFIELSIHVDDETLSKNKLNGRALVSQVLDENDLMQALNLESLKDKLLLRHLRKAVENRTLAFTLKCSGAENPLTWSEEQVVAWLCRYNGEESLKFLEEACKREHLNGIAVLQIDKNDLKTVFGITAFGPLAAVLNYMEEIRMSPGPLSQMLLQPVLTISRAIEPPSAIKLLDVGLESPFAACVLARMRGDIADFRVSRVSRVCVDRSREEAFCSMVEREGSSRQSNPKLRPSNFTDPATVAGLEALKRCFEASYYGVNSACNIVFAWHGPPVQHVEAVCRDNPRSFRTTDGGFFGAGSYFALELDYAARYAAMGPPSPSGEFGVILFAVLVSAAYVVTPDRDYPAHEPQHPSSGFSGFYSPDPQKSIALMPGYSCHFVPVKYCGQAHAVSGAHLPHDTDFQAAVEQHATAHELVTQSSEHSFPVAVVWLKRESFPDPEIEDPD